MSAEKDSLREKMRAAARERAPGLSERVAVHLRNWARWKSAATVCAFCALGDEPDLLGFAASRAARLDAPPDADALWPADKRIALPRMDDGKISMRWAGCRAALAPGRFGILEPPAEAPRAGASFDLILVPGTAFDREGGRLGRGRGHYDRFLASASGFLSGVCFDDQMVAEVPCEPHDARMDAVVTPSGIVLCGRKNIH